MAVVTNQNEFRAAIAAGETEIILGNDITLTAYSSITYAVTIKGESPGISLLWGNPTASSRMMLVLSTTGVLTLETITLDAENRDGTLVQINGGTLIMNEGAILQNVSSMTAQGAVRIASNTSTAGGTLIMNHGKVTGISSDAAVFCAGGLVTMNNDAEVSGNEATGLVIAKPTGGARGRLIMMGQSRVYGNRPRTQGAGGISVYAADVYMGVEEGDAPEVYDNRPPSGQFAGGMVLTDVSTLTMSRNAKIWGNYSDFAGGGVIAQNTAIIMRDNASIEDNICEGSYGGGGARIHQDASLILEDNAVISGNISVANGGGVYLQPGGYLEMRGNSRVNGNEGMNGAGIYLAPPTASIPLPTSALIGPNNSYPSIHNNISSGYGGGIFIGRHSRLDLTGNSLVCDNDAVSGAGICKEGILNVSQSPRVTDGLYFEDIPNTDATVYKTMHAPDITIAAELSEDGSHIVFKAVKDDIYTAVIGDAVGDDAVLAAQEPKYTDNVPVIADKLAQSASILLEVSEYVSVPNVSLVIADKGSDCELLGEMDRAAWRIPTDFGEEYAVILNEEQTKVLIAHEVYSINYCHLHGADNPNPDSYSAESEFPILLQEPEKRTDYLFAGWYDCEGNHMTEISEGTVGDIQLIALWRENKRFEINYCHLYGANNPNPHFYTTESDFPIVLEEPGKRHGYIFTGWYDCAGQRITEIPEGTRGDLLLIALWQKKTNEKLYLRFEKNAGCVYKLPEPIPVHQGEIVTIPPDKPKRPHHRFVCWNTSPCGNGKNYYPKDRIIISDSSVTLYALWTSLCCDDDIYYSKDIDKKWHGVETL